MADDAHLYVFEALLPEVEHVEHFLLDGGTQTHPIGKVFPEKLGVDHIVDEMDDFGHVRVNGDVLVLDPLLSDEVFLEADDLLGGFVDD